MEFRSLDITVISAKDLKNVNLLSTMDVYVMVAVSGDPRTAKRTQVDKDGGQNPKWNESMKFVIEESGLQSNRVSLVFQIKSDRAMGDKDIGQVQVPLKEIFDFKDEKPKLVTHNVITPSGKSKGTLDFSFLFGEKYESNVPKSVDEPVMAYPAHAGSSAGYAGQPGLYAPPAHGYAYPAPCPPPPHGYSQPSPYPPPPQGYGAPYGYPPAQQPGYPPVQGYGYPPQYAGQYGYAPPVVAPAQKTKKKKKHGGMGMGLAAGLLGGLVLGDMVEDAAEMAAYDAALDTGDFDF
ncbi:C2 domain [Dillenia turbinata]|uniref:C2 domain n=1 Tax=Dillenia turbinata TaxID=194707 RepID=A0AAN8UA14_9MAGN